MPETAESTGIDVLETRGMIPPFWRDRRVVFFANLMALFFGNDEETELLAGEVGEIDSYGGRVLPILDLLYRGGRGGRNVLVLESPPDAALCEYFKRDLGLTLPVVRTLRHREYAALGTELKQARMAAAREMLEGLIGGGEGCIDGYVTDSTLEAIAKALGRSTVCSVKASWLGNNKLLLHQHLEAEGLPVFDTEYAEGPDEVEGCLERLAARGYRRAAVKAQIGASGVGIARLETGGGERVRVPGSFFYEGRCMVQGWEEPGVGGVTSVWSPSVQVFVGEERVYLYDLTEQILGGDSVHEGNESPPSYLGEMDGLEEELNRQAEVAARWLHGQGYRGTASVDFLVVPVDGRAVAERVFVCEINARITGATYPSVLARHFTPGGAWLMRNLKFHRAETGERLLGMLAERGHLFVARASRGVLPINFNTGREGGIVKGQFLFLGENLDTCHALLKCAEEELPVKWDYVRD